MPVGDSFDHFRRNRNAAALEQQLKRRGEATRGELVRKIAALEEAEEIERKVAEEMKEFFRESTRIAAAVLTAIHKRRDDELEKRIEHDIQGFFESTREEALRALHALRAGEPQAEAHLESIFDSQAKRIANVAARTQY